MMTSQLDKLLSPQTMRALDERCMKLAHIADPRQDPYAIERHNPGLGRNLRMIASIFRVLEERLKDEPAATGKD